MTDELCKTVASSCATALSALDLDAALTALNRAQRTLSELRSRCTPSSRHRRLAETAYDLTEEAFAPVRRFHAGDLAAEDEDGDAEERKLDLECIDAARRSKAHRAIDRALAVR